MKQGGGATYHGTELQFSIGIAIVCITIEATVDPVMYLRHNKPRSYPLREACETQNHQTFSSISTLGPGDRRL